MLFIATHAEITQFKGQAALRARFPDMLARMQRRESVRVAMPKDKPAFCAVRVGTDQTRDLKLRLDAISHGAHGSTQVGAAAARPTGTTLLSSRRQTPGIVLSQSTFRIAYS